MEDAKKFEVIIIGGSYAGLSAAMALGRSLREVLIIDSGLRCNRQTPHSHNFLTQDGEKPGVIAEKARAEVLKYSTIKIIDDLAVSGKKNKNGFVVNTHTGQEFQSKKLIFATGIKDIMPDIKGFAECWGISVVHCPYCHGYELRSQKTAILANGARGLHLASLINNLTNDITILTTCKADFNPEEVSKLSQHKIEIIETEFSEIEHENGQIRNVVFNDGSKRSFSVLYAAIPFTQNSDIPLSLGCELTEQGYLKVDNFQATTVKGIYACGDNAAMMRSIANSVYTGNLAGAILNKELTDEQF
ncbi:NAD(P)/FAD-dependent oxidoreductase [Arcticibacter eurypsychrophilus]|uniref:NAD(P)/FAD-dependent oxidoreductase n=1 Tax=Arcticibacter eurypsychrophilus TaxID=1434752 RepID=UPI00084D4650|nr:NAD(P)/FAD-dependent oxidoreductase [Arcticibacter eurypsychrophilus]